MTAYKRKKDARPVIIGKTGTSKAFKNMDKAADKVDAPPVAPMDPKRREELVQQLERKGRKRIDAEEIVDEINATKMQKHSPGVKQLKAVSEARIRISQGHAYFEQGDVHFEVDSKDLNKVVDGNREGTPIDRLMDSEIVALAQACSLPVQPYSRDLLRPVLIGHIQLVWYHTFEGGDKEHDWAHLESNHANRIAWYLHGLSKYKAEPEAGAARATRGPRSSGAGKSAMLSKSYRAIKSDVKVPAGRASALLGVFNGAAKVMSFAQVVDAAKGKLKTKQDFERIVARFLKELMTAGAVEEVKS